MKCVTPMIRCYDDPPKEIKEEIKRKYNDGKTHLQQKIIPREEIQKQLRKNENLLRYLERRNKEEEAAGKWTRFQTIPCGHCYACQLNYSAQWATRIMKEAEQHKNNWWITLTYDDEHIPIGEKAICNGEIFENDGTWNGTLDQKDVQKFLNSLRKHYERLGIKDIKYYYCGEYGSETLRPHYHMVLMGVPLDITQFYDTHISHKWFKPTWKSHELDRFWGKGFCDINELEWSLAAYTARYCMKKFKHDLTKRDYYQIGKEPEFVRMSRRPGIGTRYFEKNWQKIYENDELIMRTVKGNIGAVKPPLAWDRKLKEINPELYELIKEDRKKAKERADEILREITDYTDKEILDLEQKKIETKAKMLPTRGDM